MKTLLNHPQPYPEESLASWLWRLANANYLDSPSLLLRYLSQELAQPKPLMKQVLTNLKSPEWFHGLVTLTYTNATTIYKTTLHRFAHVLTSPGQEVVWMSLTTGEVFQLLPENINRGVYSARFSWCPHCLAETSYVRLHWYVPVLTCCTTHACWLLDICPQCGTRPTEANILTGCCEQCGFVFANARTVAVPETDWLFQQCATLMMWLYDAKLPQTVLPDVPVNALLRVLQGLRYCVQRAGESWHGHHVPPNIPVQNVNILKQRKLSIYERGCLYSTAFRALLNWPHGFYAFLDAYRQRPLQLEDSGLRLEFGSLHSSWLSRFWKASEFNWIQNAYNEYLVDKMPVYQIVYSRRVQDYPELLEQIAYLDLCRTGKYLNISTYSVHRLADARYLTAHHFEGDTDSVWFAKSELDDLKQKWQQYVPFLHVVQQLGLSKRLVRELTEAQLLKVVPSMSTSKWRRIYFYPDSLQNLIQCLRPYTVIQKSEESDHLLLRDVCIRHGSVKLNLVHLLSRILAGRLRAYHTDETLLPLGDMWFMRQAVEDLSDQIKDEQDWMNKGDVQAYMGIGYRGLQQLLASKYLVPQDGDGNKQFFARQDVEVVHKRVIFMHEMRQLLNIPYVSISRLMQAGSISPLSIESNMPRHCYMFDRIAFNLWHQQYILLPEIEKLASELEIVAVSHRLQSLKFAVEFPKTYLREEVIQVLKG